MAMGRPHGGASPRDPSISEFGIFNGSYSISTQEREPASCRITADQTGRGFSASGRFRPPAQLCLRFL